MVSVVTVNYKTVDYLERMLKSLFAFHNKEHVEVFVVENGSGDDLTHLQIKYPDVTFLFSEENLGFASGCNLAIKKTKGDYVLLVNPDIIFNDDSILQIEEQMNANPNVGVGGASLKNMDGTQQSCVWRFPRPIDQLMVLFKIPHLLGAIGPVKKWLMKGFDYSRSADVNQVMGAFFCIRREVLDKIGSLDDQFFIWYEEVDFCKRVVDAGWKVRFFADVVVKHKGGSSFDKVATFKKQSMIRKSLRYYMRKHYGYGTWFLFILPEPIFILIAAIASLVKPK